MACFFRNKALLFLFVFATVSLIAGCGTAPTLNSSARLFQTNEKIKELVVFYKKPQSQNRKNEHHFNGFFEFGKHIISEAALVFSRKAVTISGGREIEFNETISLADNTQGGNSTSYILVISPVGGKFQANKHMSIADFIFNANVIDTKTMRVIWRGTVETSTWSGDDFVLKGVKKTLYDKDYATQLLTKLSEAMQRDGVI